MKSKSMSMNGWKFSKWFTGNWSSIKELMKVGIPMLVGWMATRNLTASGFITVLGKFILDAGEYFFKEYTK